MKQNLKKGSLVVFFLIGRPQYYNSNIGNTLVKLAWVLLALKQHFKLDTHQSGHINIL